MKGNETHCNAKVADIVVLNQNHGAHFIAVRDSRNRRVPGIYTRNGRYYVQLWVDRDDGKKTARKFPLLTPEGQPVSNLVAAKESADVLRNDRRQKKLPTSGHKPKFADYIETYFAKGETAQKKPGTLKLERWLLDRWKAHLGDVRIDRIDEVSVKSFREKRLLEGLTKRTVNLDLIALRNVLRSAKDDGFIRDLPKAKTMKVTASPRRPLLSEKQFEALLAAIPAACEKNAVQFRDYLRFLAFTGAREKEALRVRWQDVDTDAHKVRIGAGGVAKNREERDVDFNPSLAALIAEMKPRRAPDSIWLFPSPQRGKQDIPAKTFRESLLMVREKAAIPWVGFHDLRHRFASLSVMAGLDFMTIAAWLGHKDGGILVGKVYGHLSDTHKKAAAAKLKL